MNPQSESLLLLAEAYAAHRGISLWRVGALAAGSSKFFFRLKEGGSCRIDTYTRIVEWFDAHWPEPPEWPRNIPRPRLEDAA